MEILSVGAELIHTTVGRTNMTKQIGHIRNYANALKGTSKDQPNFVRFRLKRPQNGQDVVFVFHSSFKHFSTGGSSDISIIQNF
jgi:hypothetical protein